MQLESTDVTLHVLEVWLAVRAAVESACRASSCSPPAPGSLAGLAEQINTYTCIPRQLTQCTQSREAPGRKGRSSG